MLGQKVDYEQLSLHGNNLHSPNRERLPCHFQQQAQSQISVYFTLTGNLEIPNQLNHSRWQSVSVILVERTRAITNKHRPLDLVMNNHRVNNEQNNRLPD
jgi:hypothetical protein